MNTRRFLLAGLGAGLALGLLTAAHQISYDAGGIHIGDTASDLVGFFGATPVVQPTASAQAALTDSTTGTAATTLAAGAGVYNIVFPVQLASITTNADVVSAYVPGHKFKILGASFVVTTPATTGSKTVTLSTKIGTDVAIGNLTANSTNCATLGAIVAGAAITANHTGSATANLTVYSTSTTAFIEGQGAYVLKIQNMDTADATSSLARLGNALRTGLVNLGLLKGS